MEKQRITLESVLGSLSDINYPSGFNNESDDPIAVTMECIDIMEDLSIFEQNMTTLEAAIAIKKSKSAFTKKKIVKTKMKAKYAKAKMKCGKVVRILKASKDSDAAIHAGTGSRPITGYTLGLTDTDLDAMNPEDEVEITETVDTSAGKDIKGTEGVHFIYEYKDNSIVYLEDTLGEYLEKFGNKIQIFLDAIGKLIVALWNKILGIFKNLDEFVKTNKAAIEDRLKSSLDKEIAVNYRLKSIFALEDFLYGCYKNLLNYQKELHSASVGVERYAEIEIENEMKVFDEILSGKLKLKECGINKVGDLLFICDKAKDKFKAYYENAIQILKNAQVEATKAVSKKDEYVKKKLLIIRKVASRLQISAMMSYRVFSKSASFAYKVARVAFGVPEWLN